MIRRRRRSDFHDTKTGHERWLVSYADFVTLLFAFFVVMYSVSQVSEQKYRVLSDTLSSIFDGKVPVDAQVKDILDHYPLDNKGQTSGLSPVINLQDTEILATELQESLINMVDPQQAQISASPEWVRIELDSSLLFSSGKANPSDEARTIFSSIAEVLAPYDNEIKVAGYTDNIPISTEAFKSNWELSAVRATSIVRLLESDGVASERLSAEGYGQQRAIADNGTPEGREKNRRVVLMVSRTEAETSIVSPGYQKEFPLSPLVPAEPTPVIEPTIVVEEPDLEYIVRPEEPEVEPVRLKSGGLLFSSEPDLERQD